VDRSGNKADAGATPLPVGVARKVADFAARSLHTAVGMRLVIGFAGQAAKCQLFLRRP